MKRLAAVALSFVFAVGAVSAVAAQPAIWTVRSRTATIVLFGSIHLLPPGLDWRPPALDAALSKADELWFEVPITALSEGQANSEARSRGALPQGRHLFSLVTPDEAERLRRVAIALHCDPGAIDQMQPWMAEFTLSVAEDASGGADAYNGVEEHVLQTFTRMYERLEEGRKLLEPGQFYELRYEDLIADPAGTMKIIYDYFQLGGFERCLPRLQGYLASIKGYETNKYQLTNEQRLEITKRWGVVIRRYGYD